MDPILFAAVVVVVVLFALTRQRSASKPTAKGNTVAQPLAPDAPGEVALHWPKPKGYSFDFEVVGESHYQRSIKVLAGDHGEQAADVETIALLVPEANNPYDKSAVRVVVNGQTVGYLDKDDARGFRRRLGSKKLSGKTTSCDALIVGGYVMADGTRASYGVRLDLKPFE